MDQKKSLWTGTTVLLTAVIAVLAFTGGQLRFWLLTGAFAVWAAWAGINFLLPYLRRKWYFRQIKRERKQADVHTPAAAEEAEDERDSGQEDPAIILLRHVNYRISDRLKAAYPDAAWQWCEEYPEQLMLRGGTGRIKVFGIPDFEFADITFDTNGRISCSLIKTMPVGNPIPEKPEHAESAPEHQTAIDPQIWYTQYGQQVLEDLISDLDSRGYHSILIRENGEITVQQDDQEVTAKQLESMPERTYWPRLVKVLERAGLAASSSPAGIAVTW